MLKLPAIGSREREAVIEAIQHQWRQHFRQAACVAMVTGCISPNQWSPSNILASQRQKQRNERFSAFRRLKEGEKGGDGSEERRRFGGFSCKRRWEIIDRRAGRRMEEESEEGDGRRRVRESEESRDLLVRRKRSLSVNITSETNVSQQTWNLRPLKNIQQVGQRSKHLQETLHDEITQTESKTGNLETQTLIKTELVIFTE